jgi:hypothetical protein
MMPGTGGPLCAFVVFRRGHHKWLGHADVAVTARI